jgi:hypothetical protein
MEWDAPAPTITTQCFGYGNGRFGHPEQNRAITLREAAILQTFPESYRFLADGEQLRFSVLGRLIGNAVPVRLGEVIGHTLSHHLKAGTTALNAGAGEDRRMRRTPKSRLHASPCVATAPDVPDHGERCGRTLTSKNGGETPVTSSGRSRAGARSSRERK